MSRSLSGYINIVTLIFALFIAIPVISIKYKVTFDADKLYLPCPQGETVNSFFDLSKVDIQSNTDNTVTVVGSVHVIDEHLTNETVTVFSAIKRKSRGRWIDTPFNHYKSDFCREYQTPGEWWYEYVGKFMVGEQRKCPPAVNVELNINITIDLVIDAPTLVPVGEYMVRSVFKQGKREFCSEMYVDVNQL